MESVMVRLDAYKKQTMPILDYYKTRNLIVSIDGEKEIDDVFKQIVAKVGK